nr:hypothetical protein MarFTME_264 [Marseillevirus futianmevirus]
MDNTERENTNADSSETFWFSPPIEKLEMPLFRFVYSIFFLWKNLAKLETE